MNIVNTVTYIVIGSSIAFLIPLGIIAGIILAILGSEKTDLESKKKFKKWMWWSFLGPVGLIALVTIFSGLINIINSTIAG